MEKTRIPIEVTEDVPLVTYNIRRWGEYHFLRRAVREERLESKRAREKYIGTPIIYQFSKPADNHYQKRRAQEIAATAEIDSVLEQVKLLSERGRVAQKAVGGDYFDELADECAKMPEIMGEEEYLARIQEDLEEAS